MPIYEYECEKCGGVIEKFQNFSDKPLKICEYCSGKLHKIISQSTFHLKGTGWYVTDYSGKSQPATSSASSTDTASETKPATKAEKTEKTKSSE